MSILFVKVGDELIWEIAEQKLLGVTIDKNLNFNSHLLRLCNKVGQNVTALPGIAKLLPFNKRKLLLTHLLNHNSLIVHPFYGCFVVERWTEK